MLYISAPSTPRNSIRKKAVLPQVPSDAKRPEDLKKSVAATLSDLGCTYLDLLAIEWPCSWEPGTQNPDPSADSAATWAAMEALVAHGSVRQLGVAHHGLGQVEALLEAATTAKPVVNLLELHPLCSQRKLVGQLLRKARPAPPCAPVQHKRAASCRPAAAGCTLPDAHTATRVAAGCTTSMP